MKAEFFADTQLLRQHALELGEARRRAQRLCEELRRADGYAQATGDGRCRPLLEKARRLEEYYRRMADGLEEFSADTEAVSRRFGAELENNIACLDEALRRHAFKD